VPSIRCWFLSCNSCLNLPCTEVSDSKSAIPSALPASAGNHVTTQKVRIMRTKPSPCFGEARIHIRTCVLSFGILLILSHLLNTIIDCPVGLKPKVAISVSGYEPRLYAITIHNNKMVFQTAPKCTKQDCDANTNIAHSSYPNCTSRSSHRTRSLHFASLMQMRRYGSYR
jgi:hypothetical protein